jgi:hypothetical protein
VGGDVALLALGQLECRIGVVLGSRAHVEEQSAKSLIGEERAAVAVLVEQRLALLVREFAPHPVQHCHESLIVDHSFLLKVDELEGRVGSDAFVLLDLRPLAHSLVDSDL